MISRNRFKKGFTLIELLVVISIIGILVAVAAVSFTSTQIRARDSRRIQDMEAIQKAMEQFVAVGTGLYPGVATVVTTEPSITGFTMPKDPQTTASPARNYVFRSSSAGYCICAQLEGTYGATTNAVPAATSIVCTTGTPTATSAYYCVQNQQ